VSGRIPPNEPVSWLVIQVSHVISAFPFLKPSGQPMYDPFGEQVVTATQVLGAPPQPVMASQQRHTVASSPQALVPQVTAVPAVQGAGVLPTGFVAPVQPYSVENALDHHLQNPDPAHGGWFTVAEAAEMCQTPGQYAILHQQVKDTLQGSAQSRIKLAYDYTQLADKHAEIAQALKGQDYETKEIITLASSAKKSIDSMSARIKTLQDPSKPPRSPAWKATEEHLRQTNQTVPAMLERWCNEEFLEQIFDRIVGRNVGIYDKISIARVSKLTYGLTPLRLVQQIHLIAAVRSAGINPGGRIAHDWRIGPIDVSRTYAGDESSVWFQQLFTKDAFREEVLAMQEFHDMMARLHLVQKDRFFLVNGVPSTKNWDNILATEGRPDRLPVPYQAAVLPPPPQLQLTGPAPASGVRPDLTRDASEVDFDEYMSDGQRHDDMSPASPPSSSGSSGADAPALPRLSRVSGTPASPAHDRKDSRPAVPFPLTPVSQHASHRRGQAGSAASISRQGTPTPARRSTPPATPNVKTTPRATSSVNTTPPATPDVKTRGPTPLSQPTIHQPTPQTLPQKLLLGNESRIIDGLPNPGIKRARSLSDTFRKTSRLSSRSPLGKKARLDQTEDSLDNVEADLEDFHNSVRTRPPGQESKPVPLGEQAWNVPMDHPTHCQQYIWTLVRKYGDPGVSGIPTLTSAEGQGLKKFGTVEVVNSLAALSVCLKGKELSSHAYLVTQGLLMALRIYEGAAVAEAGEGSWARVAHRLADWQHKFGDGTLAYRGGHFSHMGGKISVTDLYTLLRSEAYPSTNGWLNTTVMEAAYAAVRPVVRHHEIHVVPMDFVSRFLQGETTGPLEGWMPPSQAPPIIRVLTVNTKDHWWQVVIWGNETLTNRLIVYAFDSKYVRDENDQHVKKIMDYCRTWNRPKGDKYQVTFDKGMESNQQANTWDCGVFCIENLRALVEGGADLIATRALLKQVKVTIATREKLIGEIEDHCREVHHLSDTNAIFPPPPPGFSTLASSSGNKKTAEEDLTKDEDDAQTIRATPAG
jgi:hypothetical protein